MTQAPSYNVGDCLAICTPSTLLTLVINNHPHAQDSQTIRVKQALREPPQPNAQRLYMVSLEAKSRGMVFRTDFITTLLPESLLLPCRKMSKTANSSICLRRS